MRVLLQNADNGTYLTASGSWTENPQEAHDFKTRAAAVEAWQNHGIMNGRVFYAFPQTASNFSVPLRRPVAQPRKRLDAP